MLTTNRIIVFFLLLIAGLGIVVFKANFGYYPVPVSIKLFYYSMVYPSTKERNQLLDDNFKINTKGYTIKRQINDALNIPHSMSVSFKENTSHITSSFKYSGKIKVIVSRNNRIVYETVTTSSDIYNINYQTSDTIGGFHLINLPFPIGRGPYTNIELTIIVEELDNYLQNNEKDVRLEIISEMLDF